MAKKIYKLCLIHGYTEAYYQLSAEQKRQLFDNITAAVTKAGAKMATPYFNSRWANDKYANFFIMEYPDIETAMRDTAAVTEIELFRYLVSETVLAVEDDTP